MTPSDFRAWMERHGLTGPAAASVLGVSLRTIRLRLSGKVPINRETELACSAVDAVPATNKPHGGRAA